MDCLIPTLEGVEEVCFKELEELTKKEIVQGKQFCILKDTSANDIAKLAYSMQSGITLLPLLARAKKLEELTLKDKKLFKDVLKEGATFAVRSMKVKEEKLVSSELHEEVGSIVSEWMKKENITPKVSLNNPDVVFMVVATGKEYFIGIDVIGFKLCKRPYKLFLHPASINSCIAYAMARYAGITKKSLVVDPFCGTGTIPIEIALYQQEMSPFHFENKFTGLALPFFKESFEKIAAVQKTKKVKESKIFGFDAQIKMMTGSKQNAKIAGVKETITFSKVAVDWIDAKFEKEEVDVIITQPPMISERTKNEKEVLKLYDELCHQTKYLLNKKGTLGVFVNHPEKLKSVAKKHKLTFKKEIEIPIGDSSFSLLLFSP